MNELRTNCPKCGKPVVFYGDFAMSSICTGCGTIVRRPGRDETIAGGAAEQLAKWPEPPQIGDLPQGDSPLEFGMKGHYQGHDFQIRGVVRLQHDAGGFWDEWYLLFDDGRWGWLAEVQQRLFLTFSIDLKGAAKIPAFNEIAWNSGSCLRAGDPPMKVAEKGNGRPVAARGEIPYDLEPQTDYRYADLSGPGGRFATIDYGDATPAVYYGKEVHLADLNLPHRHEDVSHESRHVEAVQAECPNCNHRLTLFVPHKSVRVGCTSCGALLDADEGRLQFVRATAQPPKALLPIGAGGFQRGPLHGRRLLAAMPRVGRFRRLGRVSAVQLAGRLPLADLQRQPLEFRADGPGRRGGGRLEQRGLQWPQIRVDRAGRHRGRLHPGRVLLEDRQRRAGLDDRFRPPAGDPLARDHPRRAGLRRGELVARDLYLRRSGPAGVRPDAPAAPPPRRVAQSALVGPADLCLVGGDGRSHAPGRNLLPGPRTARAGGASDIATCRRSTRPLPRAGYPRNRSAATSAHLVPRCRRTLPISAAARAVWPPAAPAALPRAATRARSSSATRSKCGPTRTWKSRSRPRPPISGWA